MLKSTVSAFALVTGLAVASIPAAAQMYSTGRTGAWETMAGISDLNQPMCSVHTTGPGMYFALKYFSVYPNKLEFFFYKQGWNIAVGQPIDVTLQVDNAMPLNLHGTGWRTPSLQANVGGFTASIDYRDVTTITKNNAITETLDLLRSGLTLKIFFPQGNEGGWTAPLYGSNAAIGRFAQCIVSLGVPQTQPYSAQPFTPTQPNRATQPYGQPL